MAARDVTDVNEAMAKLGIQDPETPGGESITIEQPKEQEPVVTTKEPEPTQEVTHEEPPEQDEQPAVKETKVDEEQRRSWQSEADRAKAYAKQLEDQLKQIQEVNRSLLNTVTPLVTKYNMQPEQSQVLKPPVADYIEDGYFNPEKHKKYMEDYSAYLKESIKSEVESSVTTNWQKRQQEETLQQQLAKVREKYPEYVNPLTGEVDVKRLQNDVQSYTSKKTLLDILDEAKGINKQPSPFDQASISAIEKNANKPQSVAASPETEPEKKEVPEKLKQAIMRGLVDPNNLPEDFDGLID